ncbi:unnamed protein product [Phytophthora fragariaefolia]|uniref:Unnamed protein product n=1 Tax=Phytophthora fragariaefolia TaxID=1490495 RepID=A0A9W6XHL3_9STRA|nr:unnamed protein product [Phytophthora fragariaefolia]
MGAPPHGCPKRSSTASGQSTARQACPTGPTGIAHCRRTRDLQRTRSYSSSTEPQTDDELSAPNTRFGCGMRNDSVSSVDFEFDDHRKEYVPKVSNNAESLRGLTANGHRSLEGIHGTPTAQFIAALVYVSTK